MPAWRSAIPRGRGEPQFPPPGVRPLEECVIALQPRTYRVNSVVHTITWHMEVLWTSPRTSGSVKAGGRFDHPKHLGFIWNEPCNVDRVHTNRARRQVRACDRPAALCDLRLRSFLEITLLRHILCFLAVRFSIGQRLFVASLNLTLHQSACQFTARRWR